MSVGGCAYSCYVASIVIIISDMNEAMASDGQSSPLKNTMMNSLEPFIRNN